MESEVGGRTNNFIERSNCRLNEKFSTLYLNILEFVQIIKEEEHYFGTLSRGIRAEAIQRKNAYRKFNK
ncbi:hypothetical protein MXB_2854, partial [Myxobolus squamalis]